MATTKKMTSREFYTAILAIADLPADLSAYAQAEIDKLNAKNEKRKTASGEIKEENKPIAEAIVKALANGQMLSADLAVAIGQTVQKVNGVAGEMCKIGTLVKSKVKVKGKGEQTAYALAPTAEDTVPTESADAEGADAEVVEDTATE